MTARSPGPPPGSTFAGHLFSRANRPFTITVLLAAVAVVGYLVLGSGGDDGSAPTTSPITTGAGSTSTSDAGQGGQGLALQRIADGFDSPVYATSPPGDPRIFVVERAGVVKVVDPDGTIRSDPFLDLSDLIDSASGVELGMLGLAFHPDFATNGRFFVHYTDLSTDSVVAEYSVSDDPNVADPDSAKQILLVDQVGFRHRGGMLTFGPDGYLYIGLGDGTEPTVNPQNLETLQGSILRIDVDGGDPYAIPPDNPFVGSDGLDEIWAYGFRNPWRFSIDPVDDRIYIGDVGEESWEEIDTVALADSGLDFGWPFMEGSHCYTDADCGSRTDLVRPVLEYPHEGDQCAVVGGFVYRGSAIPALQGHYFYADWCAGWVHSLLFDGADVTQTQDWTDSFGDDIGSIASFGLDGSGEILLVTTDTGVLDRLVPA
jgi:glucose/arabinose dehydrogenase